MSEVDWKARALAAEAKLDAMYDVLHKRDLVAPVAEAAHAARPDDRCRACGVPRKDHGADGYTLHWFVAPRAPLGGGDG